MRYKKKDIFQFFTVNIDRLYWNIFSSYSGFAKKTLMKTAKVAGLKPSKGGKRHKYVFPSNNKSMTSPGRMSLAQMTNIDMSNEDLPHDDDLSSKLVF